MANNSYAYAHAVPVAPPLDTTPSLVMGRSSEDVSLPPNRGRSTITDEQVKRLGEQGYTTGLSKSLAKSMSAFPLRIWVIDNSGSMQKPDGHRIVETTNKDQVKIVDCTRWAEIRECVSYHIQMAALLEAPTVFRLLNDPGANVGAQEFGIARGTSDMIPYDVNTGLKIMNQSSPGGCTPLTNHILDIHRIVESMRPQLVTHGHRVAIILATDGLPTDERGYGGELQKKQFVDALRLMEGLPVWIVIRLCTDEDAVVNFYNELDEQLELSLEVLDDFVGEAHEVYEYNSWLTYGLPLHRCRELGYHDRVFDMIDERKLTKEEMRDLCLLLFGRDQFDGVPDPAVDWKGFMKELDHLLKKEKGLWNPVKKKITPWIDMKKLHKSYGDGSACAIM